MKLMNLPPRFASSNQNDSISLQVSRRFTHQIVSRIYAIFLREILGYRNVKLVEYRDELPTLETERIRMFVTMEHLVSHGGAWPDPTIDLEVWLLSDYHYIPSEIQEAGAIMNPGRFGLFIPKPLIRKEDTFPKPLIYTLFQEDVNDRRYYDFIKKFDISEPVLGSIYRYAERKCGDECDEYGVYIPPHCTEGRKCALVLAPHYEDTRFLVKHILEMEFQLKVMWLGDKLKLGIRQLMSTYGGDRKNGKKFLVFHWTPSEVINSRTMEYVPVTMPRCEDMIASNDTGCKYEMTPLLKYYGKQFRQADYALNSLLLYHFKEEHIQQAFDLYDQYEDRILQAREEADSDYDQLGVTRYYDLIACDWMRSQESVWSTWKPVTTPEDVYIGGIFPLSGMGPSYLGIAPAALLAAQDINLNDTILTNHKLTVHQNDGQCRADTVMKSFIGYYIQQTRVIGILGPACSETVEPIAGVSKHFRMAVISYSAEGAFLSDRATYPYFFRTIGENRQYEHVYLQLLHRLNWHRVAALTEDGQKATEYISYMETLLKDNSIELISNKKFPRDSHDHEMNRYLLDLKSKNAKVIIADVDDKVARVIMCEAYKLEMTAENGYIWFLPIWLSNVWNLSSETQGTGGDEAPMQHSSGASSSSCTNSELLRAMNGHFSLSHAPYADDDSRLDVDGITVREWKAKYVKDLDRNGYMASDYAGYAYDAVWVYALAFDRLLREDPSYFSDLHSEHTTNRLMELIRETDFQGVSGRVRFNEAGSRYTIINVLQFVNGTANKVGHFTPNISESNYQLIGGNLVLNESAIVWMTHDGRAPDDGALVCTFDSFARIFGVNCDEVTMIVISMASVISILILSVASFLFWKVRYDRKMKTSAKYLQKLGIDLLSPTSIPFNTLDKWEIPKDRVVINRRLGEGAFGTVYGGEAQIEDEGWTAVAVKTLKVGSTTEDKVDFLSEAEAMKRFDHNNIVRLLGVCLQSEPVYTIMEFMLYGDLKTYLLARRHLVNSKQSEDSDISNKRLTMMALDVSRALSYLAEQKYVHRDVACRNCMVNAQRVVKLGDFGMARPTFENDYYRFNRKGMLPVRWMAPESLALGFFTPASDVWSYGVLLYEIITFGSFPFQGLTNNQVLEHLKNGHTLSIPAGVKPQLEGLMKACWNQDYKKRPSASEVSEFISNYPRLLNPCLDVPLASVEMVDTDSDQFELLPGLRKFKDESQPTADLLVGTQPMNDLNNGYNNVSIMSTGGAQRNNRQRAINLNDLNVATDFTTVNPLPPLDDYTEDPPSSRQPLGASQHRQTTSTNHLNVYNPVEPLLQRDTEVSKSNNSLLRYVPMFGFGKSKTITIGGTTIVTGSARGAPSAPVTSALQCTTSLGTMGGTGAGGGTSSPQSPTGSVLGMSGGTMIHPKETHAQLNITNDEEMVGTEQPEEV
uniref:receptor protein-tyrosine kinase n=1 Tax=Anopheles dirus TaxID=7168 RepID=A0A182NF26_9DIPT